MASKARARSRGKIGKGKRRRTPKPQFDNREAAIAKAAKKTKKSNIKSLEQSTGSLDRRINKAIQKGDVDLAKDLRSRKNKFTTDLGLARALELKDGVVRSNDGRVIRTSTGQPVLTSKGREIFDQTKDLDFVDSTRRLQNVAPDAYKEMYPIGSALQKGPLGFQMIKNALNRKDKDIPYRYPGTDNIFGEGDFPAQRYPLEYMGRPEAAPTEEVTIADLVPEVQPPQLPGKDEVTDKDRQAAIDRGISPEFIFPIPDDPSTEIIEQGASDGTALQLAEAANTKGELANILPENASLEARAELSEFLNRPTMVAPNVFALPESSKEALNKRAEVNRKTYEIETYGKEITSEDLAKAGVNEAFYNQSYDNPIIEKQLFQAGIIKEKDVQAPIIKDIKAAQSGESLPGQLLAAPLGLMGFGDTAVADYIRDDMFQKPNTYTGQEWLDKTKSDKKELLEKVQADNTLNDTQKIQLTDFITNPPDLTTGLLDQGDQSLSDMVINENFDTGVNTDQASLDVLNSLAEPPTYLERLFGFNKK
jgi:hypothetical protein